MSTTHRLIAEMETSSALNDTSSSLWGNMTTSDTNDTELLTSESATGASIVSPIVMFLAGLIGNVLALRVLHKTKTEIRSMMFYTLVAALTWNDLLGICLTSPPVLAAYLNERHMPALPALCRFHALAMVCFGLSTPFIVCTMAIERSLALKCSYFYSKYCTPSSARLLVLGLWLFVLFFGALPLFDLGSYSLQYPQTWCFLDFRSTLALDKAYAYAYAIINLAVVALMIFCNALVMTTLCQVRKTRRMSNASVNSTLLNTDAVEEKVRPPQHVRRRHHRDVELQMIWLLCAITTIFSVCWVPLMAYILYCLQSPTSSSPVFGLVAVRLASLNQTLNPWIYVILRKSLLSRLHRLCKECLLCGDDPDTPQPLRKALSQHPRMQMQAAQVRVRPNNYVHVRHQLCPSSQFVGQQNGAASLTEDQKRSKGSGSSSSRSGRQGGSSQASYSVCSVCKARRRTEGAGGEECFTSPTPSSSVCSRNEECSLMASPVCSVVCGNPKGQGTQPVFLLTENNQVSSSPPLPSPSFLPEREQENDRCLISPPRSGGRGGRSAANVPSYISEVDDHGYSSKVSTDSSRMSTPERPQPISVDSTNSSNSATPKEEEPVRPLLSSSTCKSGSGADVKDNGINDVGGGDGNVCLSSGVFDSQDTGGEGSTDRAEMTNRHGAMAAHGNDSSRGTGRTMSGSSAGGGNESSSSRDHPTIIHRSLSSSSGP